MRSVCLAWSTPPLSFSGLLLLQSLRPTPFIMSSQPERWSIPLRRAGLLLRVTLRQAPIPSSSLSTVLPLSSYLSLPRLLVATLNLFSSQSSESGGSEVEKFCKIALEMGFSKRFFDLASATETQQGNRKVYLISMIDKFLKLDIEVKKLGL